MHRSSPLVPLDSCLTAVACISIVHVSACSFAVSQASDLALLVGYEAEEDFNFNYSMGTQKLDLFFKNCRNRILSCIFTRAEFTLYSFVNISPTVLVIDTTMERSSRVLQHRNPKIC